MFKICELFFKANSSNLKMKTKFCLYKLTFHYNYLYSILEGRNLCCHWRWDYDQCNICKPWGSDMYITWHWGLQHHDRKQWTKVTWVPDLYYLWSILLYLYYTRLYCKGKGTSVAGSQGKMFLPCQLYTLLISLHKLVLVKNIAEMVLSHNQ